VIALAAGIDWMAAVGRLHPLILHLPIGLLVALAGVELVRRLRGRSEPDASRGVLVALLAISTFFAALTGWLLHESDDYGDPVELHEWLGIALMVVAMIVAVAHRRGSPRFGAWLVLALLLVVPTAHFGASLTHGSDFLFEPWRASDTTVAVADLDDPFAAAEPFFATYCTRCHGESKQKGGLALHDFASLMAGGDDGLVVIAGDPTASRLIERMHLPLDDDDHMPPEGKRQPTADEQAALAEWIAGLGGAVDPSVARRLAGAARDAFDPQSTDAGSSSEPDSTLASTTTPVVAPVLDHALVREATLALRERLVHVTPIAQDSELLLVDYGAAHLAPGGLSAELEPLRDWIADLDLSAHALTAEDLEFVAQLPRLGRLDLRNLPGADYDISALSKAIRVETLNLSGTTLSTGACDALAAMSSLGTVFVWQTGLAEQALRELTAARPELVVRGASAEPDAPLEVEPEVAFEAFVPEPSATLEPSNASCPITDKPVDARFTIVSSGRVIGFCCPSCPATYWADQADDESTATDR